MDDELVVHEDDIVAAKPMGLLETTQRREAIEMGFDLNDPEQAEAYRQAQEVALFVKERIRDINPVRVAIAGLILMLLVGLVASGWYWVIPRDDVEIHTVYMQRGGHLVMSELQNDGSRAIRDVVLEVQFLDAQDDLIQTMRIEVDTVKAHSSLAGDDLEMIVLGYTVWEEYTLKISVRYTMFDNSQNYMEVNHVVGTYASEVFVDQVETTTRLF
ncbi:MAG: hypothetical protein VXY42_03840 [Candidatus Thermoplasmatota archaeon]|nr:hypothetical protein [Candidatus Thermoplasmatota archaeon]MEC8609618.1 hypothetical protein [Candidatus Thermoplasmatota archaeon]